MHHDLIIIVLGWSAAIPLTGMLLYSQRNKFRALNEAYAELQKNKSLLRMMLESAAIGTAIVGPDGKWLRVNRAICELFGYTQDELLQTDFQSVTHPDDVPVGIKTMERMLRREIDHVEFEKRYLHKDGSVVWVQVYGAPVWNEDGSLKYVVSQMVDIGARKNSEKDREKLIGDLTKANNELERFSFIASHDLQEPLRTICSFIDLIDQEHGHNLGEDGKTYLAIVADAGKRMRDLIRDLLDYARVGQKEEQVTYFDSATALQFAHENLLQKIMATGAVVTSNNLPELRGQVTRFTTLLQNLIENGIKYQKPGGKPEIMVTAEDKGNIWQFSVRDNGIGLREEYARQIFEPFKRLHHDEQYQGTGMGLAICRKIVEAMGGDIWVESQPGQGSTFVFNIPKV